VDWTTQWRGAGGCFGIWKQYADLAGFPDETAPCNGNQLRKKPISSSVAPRMN
jgi:hypothetical protein